MPQDAPFRLTRRTALAALGGALARPDATLPEIEPRWLVPA